ncbi:uncharacterized protein BHQ10_004200 [Talaromyces amestolkiae]|uniref:Uncharacterized protein n=1 Tax=Talaromyces amestolkiae TaxID=1196081 RepID=A0A364KXA8_TALAM|nr:uncharacterized protein BHQ10_004200 [Talaromyces amestolkiae]RAO68188.1 hypothetical protein BHQ10_004200 [Talaromyces amestolkiae]
MPAIAPPERPELDELAAAEVVALALTASAVVALVVVVVDEDEVESVLLPDVIVEDVADTEDASAVAGAVAIVPVTVVVANKAHVPSAAQ